MLYSSTIYSYSKHGDLQALDTNYFCTKAEATADAESHITHWRARIKDYYYVAVVSKHNVHWDIHSEDDATPKHEITPVWSASHIKTDWLKAQEIANV